MSGYLRSNAVGVRRTLLGMLLSFVLQQVYAGGFQLHEQSVTYLGNAYAGSASTAEDASTTYYNPAGLKELANNQLVASAIYFYGSIKLYDARATNNVNSNVLANPTSRPSANALVPGLNLSANINKNWAVGFSVGAPFGLSNKYDATSIARYMATISSINTINLSPAVAYKINDKFSVGAGFDAMHIKAELFSAIHFAGPTAPDGYVNNYGHAWSYGYHLGVLFKPTVETKMGLVYYSAFDPKLSGHVDTAAYPVTGSRPAPTTLTSDVKLPDRLVYSVTHQYSDSWAGMADVEWVHWSRLKQLKINYNTGGSSLENLQYKNTFRVAFGVNYKYSQPLMFKGGIAFDQSPVRAEYRTARLPDADRFWIGFGAKYKFNKYISLDAAYAHLFFKHATIAQVGTSPLDKKTLYGNYRSSADLIGVQLTWNFV